MFTCKIGRANAPSSTVTFDVFQPIGGLDVCCHAHSLELGDAGGLTTPGVRHLKLLKVGMIGSHLCSKLMMDLMNLMQSNVLERPWVMVRTVKHVLIHIFEQACH